MNLRWVVFDSCGGCEFVESSQGYGPRLVETIFEDIPVKVAKDGEVRTAHYHSTRGYQHAQYDWDKDQFTAQFP